MCPHLREVLLQLGIVESPPNQSDRLVKALPIAPLNPGKLRNPVLFQARSNLFLPDRQVRNDKRDVMLRVVDRCMITLAASAVILGEIMR